MPIAPPRHVAPGTQERKQRAIKQHNAYTNGVYNHQWRKFRNLWMRDNPLCVQCMADGFICEAKELDHIVPVKDAPERMYDTTNVQSLCVRCHAIKRQQEGKLAQNHTRRAMHK
jgi:5-methylcytosine-specific restriction protein A